MAGLFDSILARSGNPAWMPTPDAAFPELTPEPDEAALAEEARTKAAKRLGKLFKGEGEHPAIGSVPDANSAGVQLAMNQAPEGTGVPFSTQAGMLPPITTAPDGSLPDPSALPPPGQVPMPMARPPGADAAPSDTDISSQSRGPGAPLQVAAPVQQQAAAAPQQPQAPAPSPYELPSILGRLRQTLGDNSNTLLALGAGFAGAPNIGQGISRAAAAAIPARAADIKQRMDLLSQNSAYQALIKAGAPEEVARAAMGNPKIMETALASYIGDRKAELKEVTLGDGRKISVWHRPYETDPRKAITDLQGNPINLANTGGIDARLTGDDAYQAAVKANPELARKALAFKEGREPWPVGRAVTAGDNQQAMDLARQMDPGLTDATAALRRQTVLDYGPKGKTGIARTAASTLMGHAEQYDKLIDRLGAWDTGGEYANNTRDFLKSTAGTDKDYLKAKGEAAELRNGVANELEKALSGRVTVSGIQEILAPLKAAKGPTEQHAAIQGIIHMLGTRLDEMSNGFDSSMNTRTEGFHMLSPKAREIYKRYTGRGAEGELPGAIPGVEDPSNLAGATPPPAAGAPIKPGGTYRYNAKGERIS